MMLSDLALRGGLLLVALTLALLALARVAGAALPARQIAYHSTRSGNVEIYLADVGRGFEFNLTRHPANDLNPAWSPDGERLAFVSGRDGIPEIYLLTLDSGQLVRLTNDSTNDFGPVWSPDGAALAYETFRGSDKVIAIHEFASGRTRIVAQQGGTYAIKPVWSPDSRNIVFYGDDRRDPELYALPLDGRAVERLTRNTFNDWEPRWSPDGEWLVYYANPDAHLDLYALHYASSATVRLTFHLSADWMPSWSPDGRYIAFLSTRNGGADELYLLDAACALPAALRAEAAAGNADTWLEAASGCDYRVGVSFAEEAPVWSPDGRWLIFLASDAIGQDLYMVDVACVERDSCAADLIRLTRSSALDAAPAWRP